MEFDLLLIGCRVIDPANKRNGKLDIAISDGKVALVAPEINPDRARRLLDVSGSWAIPGVVEMHMHTSKRHRGENAHRMLARAGVCMPWSAVELAG